MNIVKACLLPVILLVYSSLHAQRYDSLLTKLNSQYRQEKLHLHFDRPVYNPGETLWFKAYLFAAGLPSRISNTLYAELLDGNGKVVQRKTMPVMLSGAAGSFDIPANINSTQIFIRSYTKWMLNFDSALIYTKAIQLTGFNSKKITAQGNSSTAAPANAPLFFLQLLPEGGDLVQGLQSRVAFKATDAAGMPVNINGDIVDSKEKKITSFTSVHDGMGSFLLQPQPGEQYKAVWQDPSGQRHGTLLNPAQPTGVTLQLNGARDHVEFTVKRPGGKPSSYPYVTIVAQLNDLLVYSARVKLDKSAYIKSTIPVKELDAGIMQVTLFTPGEKPVAERLVFVNQHKHSFITNINATLVDMGKRKKNVIEVEVPDTLLSNLSVSVTDADLTAMHTDDNIFSRVLLTNDIKGYVHDPAYYFPADPNTVSNHLDLVMMTNGWRRFKWEDMLAVKWPTLRYSPENYISLEGQVAGLKEKQLLNKELNVIVELKNGNTHFLNADVLPGGKFILPQMIFHDTAKLFYQFNNDKNKSLTSRASFSIKKNLLQDALNFKPATRQLQQTIKPDTAITRKNEEHYARLLTEQELQKVKTLRTVEVNVRKKSIQEIKDEEYATGFFAGGDGRIFIPENDSRFTTSVSVFNYLSGMVAGLQINQSGGEVFATWRGSETAFFINEMQTQADQLQLINMNDVAMIKVFRPPFFGAMGGGSGGAVAIYLKKGADRSFTGLESLSMEGYSAVKEFYSPDYSKTTSSPGPDYRTTLYWNPFIVTQKDNRRISLTFYNNDITKKMKVIIEGCNEHGQLTRVEKLL